MRIALLALGSRGDVQPFIALGGALRRAGHTIRLIGLADYADLAATYDLPFGAVVGAAGELMDRELVYTALDVGGKQLPLSFAQRFIAQVEPLIGRLFADCLHACHGAELLIASTLGLYPGLAIAEKLSIPLIPVHFHPYGSSRYLPDLSFAAAPTWLPLKGLYNQLTHQLAQHGLWQLMRAAFNRARTDALGLSTLSAPALWAQVRRPPPLTLHAYSAAVAPPPRDYPTQRRVCGYWLLDRPAAWQPPAELETFLSAGSPPVYIGFGSVLAGRNPAAINTMLVQALAHAGLRGLIYRGAWDDLGQGGLPEHVLAIEATPHDWLFEQVAAVVTHGGAGTVAAALRAGKPIISVPFYGDQGFWGRRVADLGAGLAPIARSDLTVTRLATALQRVAADQAMQAQAARLGAQIAAEDGVGSAIEHLRSGKLLTT